ncbi:hemolysin family protein [Frankia sp. AgKG'84/4]|uniref:hemolysin family protein n=1 Tax=Frankia sp. AgKG'84/4 TaxID=573490 RepID=UPI00200CAA74|nr:hemolysin family protein [Frankia sp. AgKG'84/4]MCL9797084.1 hemolysin family protein [Frankia sp. AgKG'84/4]
MIEAILRLALVLLLVVGNALFVAAEFALVAIEPHQAERSAADGDRRSRALARAVRSLSFQLSGAQLGITVTSLAIGFLAEPALATLLRPGLRAVGLPVAPASVFALALALVVATVGQMVFGELVPKNWAISEPLRVGRAVAPPQVWFSRLARPLIAVLNGVANAILRTVGVAPQDEMHSGRSSDELGSIVRTSARQGTLTPSTASLLRRSLRFGDRDASDVMTPRVRTVWADADEPVAALLRVARSSGHSRFPVLGRAVADSGPDGDGDGDGGSDTEEIVDVDGVIGVVHVKDVFRVPSDRRSTVTVRDIMTPPLLVPASLDCDSLLTRLRREGLQLATVIDEYGGPAGIVTLEDLVEELVGEVSDEHDLPTPPGVVSDGPGSWLLSGLLRPDEAADGTGVRLPAGPFETVAGLVLTRLGRLGAVGDTVDVDGATLTVVALERHRIDRIRLTAPAPAPSTRPGTRDGRPADGARSC